MVVARWEWRTFGQSFGAAERRLASLTPQSVEKSDELYFLSPLSDASVKVRDGMIDVKHMLRTDDDGLQQWLPVKKAAFPLPPADVAAVLATMGLQAPALKSGTYSLDALIALLARARPRPRGIGVHKRRTRYTIGDCMAELSDFETDDGTTRTLAVESADPERVIAVVRALELASAPNTCVAQGLKAVAGIGAQRFAVIDVGTNSVKFHVGERAANGAWHAVADRADVTRLGQGLHETGRLSPEAIDRTVVAIVAMAAEAERHGVEAIVAVGTAGLRIAPNAAELIDAVHARCGVRVEVISGDDEARLAYRAATAALGSDSGSLVVFDTGGGSSQFSFGRPEAVDERFSVDVGAVRLTERFGLDGVTPVERLESALAVIGGGLARLSHRPKPGTLIGMGGAVTNLAAVKLGLEVYDPDVVHGTVLDRADIDRQIALYRESDREQRRAIVGLQPNRADVILAGACVVRTVLTTLAADSLTVCDRGLRHGLLAERFSVGASAPPATNRVAAPALP